MIPAELNRPADLYVCAFGEPAELAALTLAEQLRSAIPGIRLLVNAGAGSFKSQFKKADKSGALCPDPRGGRGGQSRGRFQAPA